MPPCFTVVQNVDLLEVLWSTSQWKRERCEMKWEIRKQRNTGVAFPRLNLLMSEKLFIA